MKKFLAIAASTVILGAGVYSEPANAGPICEATVEAQLREFRPLLNKVTYALRTMDEYQLEQVVRQGEAMDDRHDLALRRRGCVNDDGSLNNRVSMSTKQRQVNELKAFIAQWRSAGNQAGLPSSFVNQMMNEAKSDIQKFYGISL